MKIYKYNSFSEVPVAIKRIIAMHWRVYCLQQVVRVKSHSGGLPPEAIRQFQEICKRKGVALSDVEATRGANDLINLVRVVNGQRPVLSFFKNKD